MPKNIVICRDGTASEATGDSTNVRRVYRSLIRDPNQLCHYNAGVGTLADPRVSKVVSKVLDPAIASSVRENFCEAYTFLVRHYETVIYSGRFIADAVIIGESKVSIEFFHDIPSVKSETIRRQGNPNRRRREVNARSRAAPYG